MALSDYKITFWNTEKLDPNVTDDPDIKFIKENTGRASHNGHSVGPVITYYGYEVTVAKYTIQDDGVLLHTTKGTSLYASAGLLKKNKAYKKYVYNQWMDETYEETRRQNYAINESFCAALQTMRRWRGPVPVVELCEGGLPKDNHKCTFRKRKGKITWTCKVD